MNGDLSLSRALGGLRIANPDDASPHPSRELSTESNEVSPPAVDRPSSNPSSSQPPQHQARDPASMIPHNSHNHPGLSHRQSDAGNPFDSHLQPAYIGSSYQATSSSNPGSLPGARPVSGLYPNSMAPEADQPVSQPGHLRAEPSRSSVYGMPARNDSRSGSGHPSSIPSRESSRSYNTARQAPLPPGNSPLPPRRSSKGMGGGYASIPGVPQAPPSSSNYTPDMPLLTSSEEWKDRGAALGVRKEVDAEGRTILRSVKKGVRDFSFGRVLGEGSYSTVYLATDRQTLREYAVKVLEKKHIIKEKKIKYVNIEKNTLNRLTDHPGIVRLYYTFQDETSLYYVLDLCNGGELLGVLKKSGTFDEECSRFYGAQILDAIEYMHSRGVIHRDLKPENVLLDDQMHIKITDFGTAKLLMSEPREAKPPEEMDNMRNEDGQRAASFVGTAEYVSPELLTNKSVGKPSDLWAFGCIIYQLLAGRPPFKGGSEYLTFQRIVNLEYEFPEGFPAAARDLVERCLVLDPARRLTIEHIKNHEFFDGQKFGKELWRMKAPRLRPYMPPTQEPRVIQLNGSLTGAPAPNATSRGQQSQSNGSRPARIITELLPPTQLDIEWSPVLTRNNERILKLGDLMVISSPIPNSGHGKGDGEGHKKFSRFFGGSTTKKRQRLVMITSSGRIVLAPAGGEEKKAKQEISLLAPDCTWRSHIDAKGQVVWCVDSNGIHYTFEQSKGTSDDSGSFSADDWIESLERAKDSAISQNLVGSYSSDNGYGDMSSSMSSPASTLGGRSNFPDGFSVSDRSGRNQLSKSQASLDDTNVKRNRFSKRQSKNGLGAAF